MYTLKEGDLLHANTPTRHPHTHTRAHCPFCFFIHLSIYLVSLVILTGKLECELQQFKHNLGLLYTDVQDNS